PAPGAPADSDLNGPRGRYRWQDPVPPRAPPHCRLATRAIGITSSGAAPDRLLVIAGAMKLPGLRGRDVTVLSRPFRGTGTGLLRRTPGVPRYAAGQARGG